MRLPLPASRCSNVPPLAPVPMTMTSKWSFITEVGREAGGNLTICAERKEASGYPARDEMSKTKDKPTIFAYGFDAAGFAAPSDPLELPKLLIRFVPYASEESLEPADGIITASGIFEEWESSNSYMGRSSWLVCKNKDHMAKR